MNSLTLREAGTRIDLHNIEKRFGAQRVLHGINLTAAPGELIAIVGKSGCGKSTLLRLIAGLETPDNGEIQINGQPLRGLYSQTRVMFQDARLLPWKRVRDNVALGLKGEARGRALADRVILLEQGLVTLDLRIDLPRPRHRGSREFGAIKEQLLEAVLGYAPFKEQEEETSLFKHAIASTTK